MTIVILSKRLNIDPTTNLPFSRSAYFYISNGAGNAYMYDKGGLPVEGSLQAALIAQESELFLEAQASGQVPTATEIEIVAGIQIYIADPGMKVAVFDKTMTQEDTDIATMLQIFLPGSTAPIVAARLGMKRLLISSLIATRVDAHERGLV